MDSFNFKFHAKGVENEESLEKKSRQRLVKFAKRYNSVKSASVVVTKEAAAETPYLFKTKIIVHIAPKEVIAEKANHSPEVSLKEALEAVERQIRQVEEKKKRPWENPTKT